MKTLQDITTELANAGVPLSARSVRRKLNEAGIAPLSRGLRPSRWPARSTHAVLSAAGLDAEDDLHSAPGGVPSLRTLRAAASSRRNGRGAR